FGRGTAAPVPANTIRFGGEKLTRLSRLKNSARNCSVPVSPSPFSRVSLLIEKSRLARPGPRNILRPAFPKNPAGGSVKAVGSKYRFGPPRIILRTVRPGNTSGRSIPPPPPPTPDRERLLFKAGVNGRPDVADSRALAFHPAKMPANGVPE